MDKKVRACRVFAQVLIGVGVLCIGLGCILGWSSPGTIGELIAGFGFGLLLVGAVRMVWQKLRGDSSTKNYHAHGPAEQ